MADNYTKLRTGTNTVLVMAKHKQNIHELKDAPVVELHQQAERLAAVMTTGQKATGH